VDATRKLLDSMFDYMKEAGVRVRDLGYGKDYFPRVWDAEYISQEPGRVPRDDGEVPDLQQVQRQRRARDVAPHGARRQRAWRRRGHARHAAHEGARAIVHQPEDAAPFLQKNIFATVNSYVTQAARRAEWARRFGDDGSGMRKLLKEAETEHGATQEEVNMAQDYVRGIDGTLGDDINPTARRLIGNMIVYQNMRLLPLAIFSSLIDPGGIVVRGGTWGIRGAPSSAASPRFRKGSRKTAGNDEAYRFAQDIGAIDDTTLAHALGSSYTQGMVAEGARKWNDAFFKFNLMEQFNMSMRVSATEAAVKFVARHSGGDASPHSQRWMAELGLAKGDVILKDGRPLVRQDEFEAARHEAGRSGGGVQQDEGRAQPLGGRRDPAPERGGQADLDERPALRAHRAPEAVHVRVPEHDPEARVARGGARQLRPGRRARGLRAGDDGGGLRQGLDPGRRAQPDWKKGWDRGLRVRAACSARACSG
jgi:hypothetical protein